MKAVQTLSLVWLLLDSVAATGTICPTDVCQGTNQCVRVSAKVGDTQTTSLECMDPSVCDDAGVYSFQGKEITTAIWIECCDKLNSSCTSSIRVPRLAPNGLACKFCENDGKTCNMVKCDGDQTHCWSRTADGKDAVPQGCMTPATCDLPNKTKALAVVQVNATALQESFKCIKASAPRSLELCIALSLFSLCVSAFVL